MASEQPPPKPRSPFHSLHEELVNAVTHGFGLILAVPASIYLLLVVSQHGDAPRILACAVYVTTMTAVYAASTLSHVFRHAERRRLWRRLDQGFIYLYIVGTFTPLTAAFLHGPGWWLFLAILWGIAWFGFVSKVIWVHRVDSVATYAYVLLGWMPIVMIKPMIGLIPGGCAWWMIVGGLFYTSGTLFLTFDRYRYFHGAWHLFVIAGSASHYIGILQYAAL
jgi:hemolysin III